MRIANPLRFPGKAVVFRRNILYEPASGESRQGMACVEVWLVFGEASVRGVLPDDVVPVAMRTGTDQYWS